MRHISVTKLCKHQSNFHETFVAGKYGAESIARAPKTKRNLVSCPSESEGQETQVTIHPPRRARMRRPVATAGPWVQIWDVDDAEGATAKAGDEADGR